MIPDWRRANQNGIFSSRLLSVNFDGGCSVPIPVGQFLLSLAALLSTMLGCAGVFLSLASMTIAAAGQSGLSQTLPVADALMVEDDGEDARLVFSVSQPLTAHAFILANPDRLIIDLPETLFQIDPKQGEANRRRQTASGHAFGKGQGLVGPVRFGLLAPGRSRIVIELNQPVRLITLASGPDASRGKNELTIELKKTDAASFLQSAQAMRPNRLAQTRTESAEAGSEVDLAAAPAGTLPKARPVIVIDPGHGGVDSGAMVKGFVEKDLVFEFAKMLRQKLEESGRYKIVLTREGDSFISLRERVKIARDLGAALFISIHADSLPEGNDNVGGATVYTASERASDAEAARVAESENKADAAAGLDSEEDASEVTGILFDLARRETQAFSHVFAKSLVNYWKSAARLNKNPQRSAGFRVLRAPDVPSVLLELGYLSNSKDSLAINSPEWREKAADKVKDAVENFFASYPAPAGLQTSKPASGGSPKELPDLRELIGEEAASPGHLAAELPPKTR